MELLLISVSILAGIFALILALAVVLWTIGGAVDLFRYAADQGFIGIAVYAACWVFLFPIMLVASLVLGFIDFQWGDKLMARYLRQQYGSADDDEAPRDFSWLQPKR